MAHFEIEIKSLLGEKANADILVERMRELDPAVSIESQNKQLNHYFHKGNVQDLYKKVEYLFTGEQHDKFKKIVERGEEFSVRTRQRDDEVLLVIKASVDEGTSSNTVRRMEFEEPVEVTLDELDSILLDAGFEYQAKWSRERQEYLYKGINVCLDKNAGYGYLAEFEKIVASEEMADEAHKEINLLMDELNVVELEQDRLARMFAFYNENWRDYYGTDKVFVVE